MSDTTEELQCELEFIWDRQIAQQQLWHDWSNMSDAERAALTKELLLALDEEVAELKRGVDRSKFHILRSPGKLDKEALAQNGAACMKMLVAVLALHGVTADEFRQGFWRETYQVDQKWRWQRMDLLESKVLMSDLDGVVCAWAEGFRRFLKERGIQMPAGGINDPLMDSAKEDFYENHGFANLEAVPGAVEVLRWWKENPKHKTVLVTARPYKRHRSVYTDTINWLGIHGIPFDHILFMRDKSEAVSQIQPAEIVAFLEDRGKHALEVAATGVDVLKLPFESPELIIHPKIQHVEGWDQIRQTLETRCSPR